MNSAVGQLFYDCKDDEEAVYPGAEEICDGLDNDCNEETSDEAVCLAGVCGDGEFRAVS